MVLTFSILIQSPVFTHLKVNNVCEKFALDCHREYCLSLYG